MKVTIFGAGYVGLVTGVCFAEIGHDVMLVDVDHRRVEQLRGGISPIYEPGLEDLLAKNIQAGRIAFTTEVQQAVEFGEAQFIAVGTPPDEDGSADLQYVLAVAANIGQHMTEDKVIVTKSTVPVGTAAKVQQVVAETLAKRSNTKNLRAHVASNPEFLKEGAAIDDFMNPDRVVVGVDSPVAERCLHALYLPLLGEALDDKLVVVEVASSELIKYASNAMLATKISFVNELSRVAEQVGANIKDVTYGMSLDRRIGPHFINPGCGYGGSCFPKDVQALVKTAQQYGEPMRLLQAVEDVNKEQKQRLGMKVEHHFGADLKGKTFALWGLAFKPQTDDIREASSRVILQHLLDAGAKVKAYDPKAMPAFAALYPNSSDCLEFCSDVNETLQDVDALVVATEWDVFTQQQPADFAARLADKVVFDGRNIFCAKACEQAGLTYYGIGVGQQCTGTVKLDKECA